MPTPKPADLSLNAGERAQLAARLQALGVPAAQANAVIAGGPTRRAAAARLKAWLRTRPRNI
jgi:hypothetical protein